MENACVILIRHVKCMGYFNIRQVKCMGYFNSPSEMCHLILTPKSAITLINGLQIFLYIVFSKTPKLQLGVYICDHTNRLKLTTNKQCI